MMRKVEFNPFNSIVSILITVGVLVGIYYLVKGFFAILGIITPVLLIAAAFLNWKVFPDYGKWLVKQLKNNLLFGVLACIGTVVFFPVVAGFLCAKAYFRYKTGKMMEAGQQRHEAEFVDFEEVKDMPNRPLKLPEMEKPSETVDYDQLFD